MSTEWSCLRNPGEIRTAQGSAEEGAYTKRQSRLRQGKSTVGRKKKEGREGHTGHQNARREACQIRGTAIGSVDESWNPTDAITGHMFLETTSKAGAAPNEEHDVLLAGTLRAIQCLRNACDRERVRFRGQVADGREDHIRMLPRKPVHLPTEGHADGVGGDKLNNRRPMLMCRTTLASVVPDEPRGTQDSVKRPDDQGGPEVVPVSATSTRDKVSDTLSADRLVPAVTLESCETGVGEDVLDFARMEISADDEDATYVRDGVSSELRIWYTRYLPYEEDVGEKEELEEGVADEADRQDGCQREGDQCGRAPSHPPVAEIELLGKAME